LAASSRWIGQQFIDFELPSREELLAKLTAHSDLVRALTRT
jgi:hypothetical protein